MKISKPVIAAILALSAVAAVAAPPSKGGQGGESQEIVQLSRATSFGYYGNGGAASAKFDLDAAVPAGKRLIIERVSYGVALPPDQTFSCMFVQGGIIEYAPPAQATRKTPSTTHYHATYQTQLLVHEGDYSFDCFRFGAAGDAPLHVVITGRYISSN